MRNPGEMTDSAVNLELADHLLDVCDVCDTCGDAERALEAMEFVCNRVEGSSIRVEYNENHGWQVSATAPAGPGRYPYHWTGLLSFPEGSACDPARSIARAALFVARAIQKDEVTP